MLCVDYVGSYITSVSQLLLLELFCDKQDVVSALYHYVIVTLCYININRTYLWQLDTFRINTSMKK